MARLTLTRLTLARLTMARLILAPSRPGLTLLVALLIILTRLTPGLRVRLARLTLARLTVAWPTLARLTLNFKVLDVKINFKVRDGHLLRRPSPTPGPGPASESRPSRRSYHSHDKRTARARRLNFKLHYLRLDEVTVTDSRSPAATALTEESESLETKKRKFKRISMAKMASC
jgi:hypothetical protein